ncbi:TetR/AcrR family transcriptional regulator [Actinomadura madurae]|uniref:TetR/AcrR family transcriptional regulator n=1 Tax=Actinomadura madurae TaxID=1993 RepID=UPI0020D250C6|nr:TetR/AcrR family transcriptional regulator [Actinomadura madurae]MCP9978944.1 TetR/AcrR family transcriptional regulator [Actinomadura madurae]
MSAVPAGDPSGHTHHPAPEQGRALAGLRERKKQRTRLALIDAALDLFLAKGYEATTIDEIVAAVEVSQRTFFRYFGTKEDVVTSFLSEHDQLMGEALAARPPGNGRSPRCSSRCAWCCARSPRATRPTAPGGAASGR